MADIMKPSIHLNGTSRGALYEGYRTAYVAVNDAIEALQATFPHERDYYPQGSPAYMKARHEHVIRLDRMRMVRQQLEELVHYTMGDGR